jgi:hypothetical protein
MGAGSQIAEYTENVIISRGYRGYSFEVEEIAPGKWDATVTYEPITSISGGPTVKGTEFPVTSDPDLLISKVKERIDETLTWYAEKGIQPRRTSGRKPTPRRGVGRAASRRGERIEAEQEEIEAEARAETAEAAERFARSYVQFGYDPDASKAQNIRNMEAKISALRDEIRVTRDPGARRDLSELVDTIASMVKRMKSGKSAFASTRQRRNPAVKKPRRLTRKQLAALSSASFALPSKRMFPIHNLAYVRVAMVDIESAHEKGKISDADRNRAMKKAEKVMTSAIDRAIAAEANPTSLPFKTKKNPGGFFGRSDAPALDAGRKWEKEYEKQLRRWMRSLGRRQADFDALMDAYDALELARANYFLADDEKKSDEMADQKRELRERIIEVLEERGKKAVTPDADVVEAEFTEGPTTGPTTASSSASAARSGIRAQGSGHRAARVPSSSRKRGAARSGVFEQVDNPTAKRHGKTGRDYLKKADEYWDKYYKKGKSKDLIDAYKYLTLAHEELKYAGDKEKLKEAKAGLNAATAELKLGLK